MRNNWLSTAATFAEYRAVLDIQRFDRIPLHQMAVSSRLAFLPSYRDGVGRSHLFEFNYQCGAERDTKLCFLLCAPKLGPMFKRLGYREYAAPVVHPVVGHLLRLCLVFDDLDYLDAVSSPFLAVAEQLALRPTRRPWMNELFLQRGEPHGA